MLTINVPGPIDPVIRRLIGTHRIQRIPVNDKAGRRHTSTATVAAFGDYERRAVPVVTREDCDVEADSREISFGSVATNAHGRRRYSTVLARMPRVARRAASGITGKTLCSRYCCSIWLQS